jgi:hypothetical protein
MLAQQEVSSGEEKATIMKITHQEKPLDPAEFLRTHRTRPLVERVPATIAWCAKLVAMFVIRQALGC